jgi:hypothetical protein
VTLARAALFGSAFQPLYPIRAYTKTNYAILIYGASANSICLHNRLSIKRIDAI